MDQLDIADRALAGRRRQKLEWYEREIIMKQTELVSLWKQLRDDPLQPYLANHGSLEEYLIDRWKMSTRRLQQIAAGEVIRAEIAEQASPELAPAVERMNEGVLREIKALPPAQRMPVIAEAVRTPGKITAAKIKLAKARVIAPTLDASTHEVQACCPTCHRPLDG